MVSATERVMTWSNRDSNPLPLEEEIDYIFPLVYQYRMRYEGAGIREVFLVYERISWYTRGFPRMVCGDTYGRQSCSLT